VLVDYETSVEKYLYLSFGRDDRKKELYEKIDKLNPGGALNRETFNEEILPSILDFYLSCANYETREFNEKNLIHNYFIRPRVTGNIRSILGDGVGILLKGSINNTNEGIRFLVNDVLLCEDTECEEFELEIRCHGYREGAFRNINRRNNALTEEALERVPYIVDLKKMNDFKEMWDDFLDFELEVMKSKTKYYPVKQYSVIEVYKIEYNSENLSRYDGHILYKGKSTKDLFITGVKPSEDIEDTLPLIKLEIDLNQVESSKSLRNFARNSSSLANRSSALRNSELRVREDFSYDFGVTDLGNNFWRPFRERKEDNIMELYYQLDRDFFDKDEGYEIEKIEKRLDEEVGEEAVILSNISGDKALYNRSKRVLEDIYSGRSAKSPLITRYLIEPYKVKESEKSVEYEEFKKNLKLDLNENQAKAVYKALNSKGLYLIQGPPGTGKTQTITEMIYQFNKQGKKVVLSSQTHVAINNVIERLPQELDIFPIRLISGERRNEFTPDKIVDQMYRKFNRKYQEKLDDYKQYREEVQRLEENRDRIIQIYRKIKDRRGRVKELKEEQKVVEGELHSCHEEVGDIETERTILERRHKNTEELIRRKLTGTYRFEVEELLSAFDISGKDFIERLQDEVSKAEPVEKIKFHDFDSFLAWQKKWCSEKRKKELRATLNKGKNSSSGELQEISRKIKELQAERAERQEDGDEGGVVYLTKKIKTLSQKRKELEEKAPSSQTRNDIKVKFIFSKGKDIQEELQKLEVLESKIKKIVKELLEGLEEENSLLEGDLDNLDTKLNNLEREKKRLEARDKGLNNDIKEQEDPIKKEDIKLENLFDEYYDLMGSFERKEREEDKIEEINEFLKKKKAELEVRTEEFNLTKDIYKNIIEYSETKNSKVKDVIAQDRIERTKKIFERNANVYGLTCTSSPVYSASRNNYLKEAGIDEIKLYNIDFDVVIIDEVSKATPLELMIPILYGKSIILVGDHRQLPPTFKYHKSNVNALEEGVKGEYKDKFDGYKEMVESSLFKAMFEALPESNKEILKKQYRMHEDIMNVINCFYSNQLELGAENQNESKQHYLDIKSGGRRVFSPKRSVYWFNSYLDSEGKLAKETVEDGQTSFYNPNEVELTVKILKKLEEGYRDIFKEGREIKKQSVGVITTYAKQASQVIKRIKNDKLRFKSVDLSFRSITTVDEFQGDEKDIIIVNMVRNNNRTNIGEFVKKFERINVAYSRARKMLIIVGAKEFFERLEVEIPDINDGTIEEIRVYKNIIDIIQTKGMVFNKPIHMFEREELDEGTR